MGLARSLAEILADPAALEPPAVVIPRLAWRGRITLLAGREKRGKSTVTTAGAAAASRAEKWLGDPTPRDTRVLWVALEEHVADLAARMVDWRADSNAIHVLDGLVACDDLIAAIHDEARALGATLVVIDTLAALVEATGARPDPGSSTAWAPTMAGLARLARETDAAVLILHHARKSDGAYRDSSAIGAAVDVIIEMADDPADPAVRVLRARGRWNVPGYAIRLRPADQEKPPAYELSAGELSLDARILLHVERNPGCSMRSIRETVGGRSAELTAAVKRLVDSGAIHNQGSATAMALHTGPPPAPPPAPDAGSHAGSCDPPGNQPGNHSEDPPGSGQRPFGNKGGNHWGTTPKSAVVPDPKPIGAGSGTTPDSCLVCRLDPRAQGAPDEAWCVACHHAIEDDGPTRCLGDQGAAWGAL